MNEVPDGSVDFVIASPSEPKFAEHDLLTRNYMELKYFLMRKFSALEKVFGETLRVLKKNGVFVFNVGIPTKGSITGDALDKVGLSTIAPLYPYWWAEYILCCTELRLGLDITVIKLGTVPVTEEQADTNVIPNSEHYFVFSKTGQFKFYPEKAPQGICFTGWAMIKDRYKDIKKLKEEVRENYGNVIIPTPFDTDILTSLISIFTDEGDTLLDPLCGMGTLAEIASKMNRNTILYEIRRELEPIIKEKIKVAGAR